LAIGPGFRQPDLKTPTKLYLSFLIPESYRMASWIKPPSNAVTRLIPDWQQTSTSLRISEGMNPRFSRFRLLSHCRTPRFHTSFCQSQPLSVWISSSEFVLATPSNGHGSVVQDVYDLERPYTEHQPPSIFPRVRLRHFEVLLESAGTLFLDFLVNGSRQNLTHACHSPVWLTFRRWS